jgi:large subunit ribosomal protein L21
MLEGGVNFMYAIIKTGGKQYKVSEGDVLSIEKLEIAEGETVVFDQVLAASDDSGVKIGRPLLEGASVKAKVLEQGKDKKILVFKYKAKSNYRRRQGHRQPFTKIEIEKIQA